MSVWAVQGTEEVAGSHCARQRLAGWDARDVPPNVHRAQVCLPPAARPTAPLRAALQPFSPSALRALRILTVGPCPLMLLPPTGRCLA